MTLGVAGVAGEDDKHFGRPTDIAWLKDGTFFVSDGYTNTRVVKFDKDGKYLMAWGTKGTEPGAVPDAAFDRHRSGHAPRLRGRPGERAHSSVRRKRQIPRSMAEHSLGVSYFYDR